MSARDRFSIGLVSSLMAVLVWVSTPSARADAIETALREEAPKVFKYVKDHGYRTVGVLKFAVKKGNKPASFDAGTLNTKVARSLEHALVLLNDPSKPIGIIQDASQAAARSRGATLRGAKGRRGLMEHTYPVAWESQPKPPDAFLTGEILVRADLKTLAIAIGLFDRKQPDRITEISRVKDIPMDRNTLAGIGQTFVLSRGLKHRGARELDEAAADDASNRDTATANPAQDSDDPVKLQILYDDQPVVLEADPSSPGELKAMRTRKAKDPKEGQKVKFVITNNTQTQAGVVLAIDGKNTLFAEDLTAKQPGECTKWILGPGESYTIEGFYLSEDGRSIRSRCSPTTSRPRSSCRPTRRAFSHCSRSSRTDRRRARAG